MIRFPYAFIDMTTDELIQEIYQAYMEELVSKGEDLVINISEFEELLNRSTDKHVLAEAKNIALYLHRPTAVRTSSNFGSEMFLPRVISNDIPRASQQLSPHEEVYANSPSLDSPNKIFFSEEE
jgi:hypothetical protein